MDIKQALGARIKELRHKKGLTQEEFSDIINVAPRHVSRIENGVNTPSIEALDRIAAALGVEIKELYNFQHFADENYLKKDISEILNSLNQQELIQAHRVLSAMFR